MTNLRLSHPNLYRALTTYALICVALGLNFIILNPAFPASVPPKTLTGSFFLVLGVSKLVLLNFYRSLRLLRLAMAVVIGAMIFYGLVLTAAFFTQHQTSLQLPITYFGLAVVGLPLLIEPYVNPLTNKNGAMNGTDKGAQS